MEQTFLEDIYEMLQYKLDPQSPACLSDTLDRNRKKALEKAAGTSRALAKVNLAFGHQFYC